MLLLNGSNHFTARATFRGGVSGSIPSTALISQRINTGCGPDLVAARFQFDASIPGPFKTSGVAYILAMSVPVFSGTIGSEINTGLLSNYEFAHWTNGSSDVVRVTDTFSTGEVSSVSEVNNVCTHSDGTIWVTFQSLNKVKRINSAGTVLQTLSVSTSPRCPVEGPDGNVWVTCIDSDQVAKLTSGGSVTYYSATDVRSLFVADGKIWGTQFGINASGGYLCSITTAGSVTYFSAPDPIAGTVLGHGCLGSDGNLWVCDDSTYVFKVSTAGSVLATYTIVAGQIGGIVSNGGYLWVLVSGADKVVQLDTNGNTVNTINGIGHSSSMRPRGICVGPDQDVWVVYPGFYSGSAQITDGSLLQIRINGSSIGWVTSSTFTSGTIVGNNTFNTMASSVDSLYFACRNDDSVHRVKFIPSSLGRVIVSGSIVQTTSIASQSVTGKVIVSGSVSQSSIKSSQSLAGSVTVSGTSSQVTNNVEQSLTGIIVTVVVGSIVQTQPEPTQELSGKVIVSGAISQTSQSNAQSLSGVVICSGSILQSTIPTQQSLSGSVVVQGSIQNTTSISSQDMDGLVIISGTSSQISGISSQSLNGNVLIQGTIQQTSKIPVQEATGVVLSNAVSGSISQTTIKSSQSLSGLVVVSGSIAQTITKSNQNISGNVYISGTSSQVSKIALQSLDGYVIVSGSSVQTINNGDSSSSGKVLIQGSIQQSAKIPIDSIAADLIVSGSITQISKPAFNTMAQVIFPSLYLKPPRSPLRLSNANIYTQGRLVSLNSRGVLDSSLIHSLSHDDIYLDTSLTISSSTVNTIFVDAASTPTRTITLPSDLGKFIHLGRNSTTSFDYSILEQASSFTSLSDQRKGFFSLDGRYLYLNDAKSGFSSQILKVSTTNGTSIQLDNILGGAIRCAADSNVENLYALRSSSINVYDLSTDTLDRTITGFTGTLRWIALSKDGTKLWVAGTRLYSVLLSDDTVTQIGIPTGGIDALVDTGTELITISNSPVTVGSDTSNIVRISRTDGSTLGVLMPSNGYGLAYRDGKIAVVANDGVRVYDSTTLILEESYADSNTGSSPTSSIDFDDHFIYYNILNTTTKVLNYPNLSLVKTITKTPGAGYGGFWNSGNYGLSSGYQRILAVINTSTTSDATSSISFYRQVPTESTVQIGNLELPYYKDGISFVSASGEWLSAWRKYGLVPARTFLGSDGFSLLTEDDVSGTDLAPGSAELLTEDSESELANSRQFVVDDRLSFEADLDLDEQYTRWWSKINPATTLTSIDTDGTTLTPTANGTASSVVDSTGRYVQYLSSTVVDTEAGWTNTTFTHTQTRLNPDLVFTIKTGPNSTDLQNIRTWIGLFSANPTTSDSPAIHIAAFRYITAVDGTAFFRCVTKDGTNTETTTTSVAISTDTRYILRIKCTATSIIFLINNETVATHSTYLPSSSQGLNYFCVLTNRLAGTGRRLLINGVRCSQR